MVSSTNWIPCVANPARFDCSHCPVGPEVPCRFRTDETLRHERAARYSGEASLDMGQAGDAPAVAVAAKEVLVRQRMALPASALLALLPQELATNLEARQVESLLRTVPGIRETSPRMFKWQGVELPFVAYRVTDDLSAGAAIAKMVARYQTLPNEARRAKFKRLAALRRLREFGQLEVATDSITSSIDRLTPSVLQREGWRLKDAVAFATDGSLVPPAQDPEAVGYLERRALLVDISALSMLGEFDSLDESCGQLRRELACHNLGLSAAIARKYTPGQFLQYADLFQSGILGLYTAIDRYDPYLGYEFSTYATAWIRQAITRTIANEERVIRIPVHALDILEKIRASQGDLNRHLGREPTLAEVANELGMTVEQVANLTQRAQAVIPLSDDIVESTRDPRNEIHEAEDAIVASTMIQMLMKGLTERERQIVQLRFGFGKSGPQTLEQVGRALGVTRERIRQIEAKALKKLRSRARRSARFQPSRPSRSVSPSDFSSTPSAGFRIRTRRDPNMGVW